MAGSGMREHDPAEAERVQPAVALQEAAAIAEAAKRAASTPRWLGGAWLAVFVAAMVAIAAGSVMRISGSGVWSGAAATAVLFGGVGLFAVWVSGPIVVGLRLRRRGVLPRRDPFLPSAAVGEMPRRRSVVTTVLIGLAIGGIGYWMGATDSSGSHRGGSWALIGALLLSTAAVAISLLPSLRAARRAE
jgi:hypothetical protein